MSSLFDAVKKKPIATEYFSPQYTKAVKELDRYYRLEAEIKRITGYDLETLTRLFAAGFTIKIPEGYELSMNTVADLFFK